MDDFMPKTVLHAFAGLGFLFISIKALGFLRLLASSLILPGKSLSKFGSKGSWAVITGASDGIGKEFVLQLARQGLNLVLISRTSSKLQALEREVKDINVNIQTRLWAMDFTANLASDYESLMSLVEGLDVAILINNVGQSHSIPVPFLETELSEMTNIINVNCVGTLRVTKIVAPGMVSRRRGLILTIASFGGVYPSPLLATYSGSKAFLQQWGTALAAELKPAGVTVRVVQSHFVTSAMSKIRKSSIMVPTPKAFVQATLAKIGRSGGSQGIAFTSTPWWSHGIMQWTIDTLFGQMSYFVLSKNKAMAESVRRRALRKLDRDALKQQ